MDETTAQPHTPTPETQPQKRGRGLLWGFVAVLLAFGAGFGWQYYEADLVREELAATQQMLQVERLRVRLGQAAISAQAGDYESARRQMSDFFTRLDASKELGELPDALTALADEFLATRDDVITGLSRSNAQYAGVLYGMLDRFTDVAGIEETMVPTEPAPEASTPAMPADTMADGG